MWVYERAVRGTLQRLFETRECVKSEVIYALKPELRGGRMCAPLSKAVRVICGLPRRVYVYCGLLHSMADQFRSNLLADFSINSCSCVCRAIISMFKHNISLTNPT